jgi:hypothetical protein
MTTTLSLLPKTCSGYCYSFCYTTHTHTHTHNMWFIGTAVKRLYFNVWMCTIFSNLHKKVMNVWSLIVRYIQVYLRETGCEKSSGLGYVLVAGSCWRTYEPAGSIKGHSWVTDSTLRNTVFCRVCYQVLKKPRFARCTGRSGCHVHGVKWTSLLGHDNFLLLL